MYLLDKPLVKCWIHKPNLCTQVLEIYWVYFVSKSETSSNDKPIYGIVCRNCYRYIITKDNHLAYIHRQHLYTLALPGRCANTAGLQELNQINAVHKWKKEAENQLALLDVLITCTKYKYESSVYCKSTFNRQYLNFNSYHPYNIKKEVICTYNIRPKS